MKSYATYDEVGNLTGAYLQDVLPEHEDCHIEVPAEQRREWPLYRANEARDGLELLPAAAPPEPTEAEIVAAYMAEVQQHMDAQAIAYGYDNLVSVITYADEPSVERYQTEGLAFRAWRSLCWARCEEVLAEYQAGIRAAPTHAELIAEMPALGLGAPAHFA